MKTIFSGSYNETMNLKNLLEINHIEAFIQNENMGIIEPWVITSGGFNPFKIIVKAEDVEKAQKIIEDYENGNLNLSTE